MTGTWRRGLLGGLLTWSLAHGVALAQPQPLADVSVLIQANTRPLARAGQPVDYMLVVGNAGPSVATGVRVSFSSANLNNVVASGACSALPCMITTQGVGFNASIFVHATVAADGPFTLSAGVNPRQKDPNPSNNMASVTVASRPKQLAADVSLSILPVGKPAARIGQAVDYRLVVANAGPTAATGVSVRYKSANLAGLQVGGACSALPCMITTLGSGYNATIDVHATVSADGPFTLSAGAFSRENDPDPSNNSATVTLATPAPKPKRPPGGPADVSLSIQPVGKSLARTGQGVDYRLVVGNAGPSVATDVSVRLKSANLTGLQVSGACGQMPCTIGALGVGAKASILVHQTVVGDRPFTLAAGAFSGQTDPNPSNNTANVTVAPPPPPPKRGPADVSLSLQPVGPHSARAGQQVDYRLIVGNAGPAAARGVAVSLKSANLADPEVSGECARLPCTIRALAAGATASITLRQRVVADRPFSLTAMAVASQTDPDPANNSEGVAVDPPPGPRRGQWLRWLLFTGGGLLALGLGTAAFVHAHGRARWLRQLSVKAVRGTEDALASGPLAFAAPSVGVTVRCEAGETGPLGPVPVLKVVSDD